MDFQDNFTCPLCLQLAKEAVQSSCCTKIFCQRCITDAVKKFGHCPCCRSTNIDCKPSNIARKVISEIKVPCDHCEQKVEIGEMTNHLNKCPKMKIKCRLCETEFTQGQMPVHTATVHQKEAKQYLIKYVLQQKKNQNSKIMEPPKPVPQDHNYFQSVNNRLGRRAIIGTTGKYYCRGQMKGKCSCCDGSCGPDDGQNCDACMQLDVKRWSLAKTYLVNPNGYICQVMRVQGVPRVSCFRIYGNKKGAIFTKNEPITCKIGSACNSCLQVENSIKLGRYNGLY